MNYDAFQKSKGPLFDTRKQQRNWSQAALDCEIANVAQSRNHNKITEMETIEC